MATWQCITGCGACCYLEPSQRPDLDQYLTPTELAQYLSFVGTDGWCIHFDTETRRCRIYPERPRFCRVEPEPFAAMYGVAPEDLDEFAIHCCVQQIADRYGEESDEMNRFCEAVGEAG